MCEGVDVGRKVVLLAPMLGFGRDALTSGLKVDFAAHAAEIATNMPLTYRIGSEAALLDFFVGSDNFLRVNQGNSVEAVLVAAGGQDPSLTFPESIDFAVGKISAIAPGAQTETAVVDEAGHGVDTLLERGFGPRLASFLSLDSRG
jgi:hypothetical protein